MSGPALKQESAGLASLDRAALVMRWTDHHGRPPSCNLSRALIEKAPAFEIRCRAFGGLKASMRRALRPAPAPGDVRPRVRSVSQGARLVRAWPGRTCCQSLRKTGPRWNGRCSVRSVRPVRPGSRPPPHRAGGVMPAVPPRERTLRRPRSAEGRYRRISGPCRSRLPFISTASPSWTRFACASWRGTCSSRTWSK